MTNQRAYYLGDADLDGAVNAADMGPLGLNWQRVDDSLTWANGDFNGDGRVDANDLNFLGSNWQKGTRYRALAAAAVNARVPRAPLANHVVAGIAQQDAISEFKESSLDRPIRSEFEASKAAFTNTLVRHRSRRYAVWSKVHSHQELTEIGQERLVDNVLERW